MNEAVLARYEKAKTIMQGAMPARVVKNDAVFSHWIENSHCFWYVRETHNGKQYRLVDAETGNNALAFDHEALANALAKNTGQVVDPQDLPIKDKDVSMTCTPLHFHFQAFKKRWLFKPDKSQLEEMEAVQRSLHSPHNIEDAFLPAGLQIIQQALISPDGKKSVFVHEHNVWIRDQTTGKEHALTKDGAEDYRYACDLLNFDTNPQVMWSPDSNRLFTIQLDTRKVGSRPYISYASRDGSPQHPKLTHTKIAYAGDEHVETYQLVVIDINTGHLQKVDYPPLPLINFGEVPLGFFRAGLGWWSHDNRRGFFIDIARGAKAVRVVELDTHTGATRMLFEETSSTFVKLQHSLLDPPLFLPLPESDELIWFSERSGWGHLYLYDLNGGKLKHPITEGEWLVRGILHYDVKQREILLQTASRDPNVSPYYRDICKVNIDSGELTTLISGCFDYRVYQPSCIALMELEALGMDRFDIDGVSPCGQYLVTTQSRVDTIPVSVLIDRNGKEILKLETADISGLPKDWHWPEPVKLKGADDQTDIYGVVFRPPGFSPNKKYPVVNYANSSRGACDLPQGSFFNSPYVGYDYLLAAALAALGFIVVMIEGRGTPLRSKAFHDHHYGDPAFTSDFTDRIAGLRQLAKRYPYMDLERVGITGIEMQTNSVYALLNHSDFYKVAVVNQLFDPRCNTALMGETYDGTSDLATRINIHDTEYSVESFSGKLLLIQGMLSFATPGGMFRLVEALQKANKDFDMLCLPNLRNCMSSYSTRREWDYLVKNLQDIEPPSEFQLTTGRDFYEE